MAIKRITEKECNMLYNEYKTPVRVINHCKAVTMVAVRIGEELNKHGYNLDIDLIKGAALAHDVARIMDQHWVVASDALLKMGYKAESDIVKVHMTYSHFNSIKNINETDLVCLGDRLVKEDKYVGLDERINYIINKAGNVPEKTAKILTKKKETKLLIESIEAVNGVTIDELFNEGKDI